MALDLAVVKKANDIKAYINQPAVVKQLESALPKFLNAERFLRTFFTAVLRNPKLVDCTRESLLSCMINLAQLGMEPVLGKAAIIPYGNEAQFQPMYRGLIDLARRHSNVLITAHVVHQNDEFNYEYGLNENLHHKPAERDRGEPRGAYTVWTFPEKGVPREYWAQSFLYLPAYDIFEIRDRYSKAYQRAMKYPNDKNAQETPWITRPGEMMKKTVIIQHSKLQPCSIEMEVAIEADHLAETGGSQLGAFSFLTTDPAAAAVPKGHAPADDFADLVKDHDPAKVEAFLGAMVEAYEGQYTLEDIKKQALEQKDEFLRRLSEWTPPPKTLKEQIVRLKTTGLVQWEKERHAEITGSLYENTKAISDDDLNFFLGKWKSVIMQDYTASGQPGYRAPAPEGSTQEQQQQQQQGSLLGQERKGAFLKEIGQYEQTLPRPVFMRTLLNNGAASNLEQTDPANYAGILTALKSALDEYNAR